MGLVKIRRPRLVRINSLVRPTGHLSLQGTVRNIHEIRIFRVDENGRQFLMSRRMVLVPFVAEKEFDFRHRAAQGDGGFHFRLVDPLSRGPMARLGHHPQGVAVAHGGHLLRRFAAVASALHRIPAPRLACPFGPVLAAVVGLLDEPSFVIVIEQVRRPFAGRTEMEDRSARRAVDPEADHAIVEEFGIGHGSGVECCGDQGEGWKAGSHDCGGGTGRPSRKASSQTLMRRR